MKLIIILLVSLVIISLSGEISSQRFRIPSGRGIGGSGKPRDHFKQLNSRKAAEDAARNAGKGNPPIHHQPHKPGQSPHFHPADKKGEKLNQGQHYSYPKNKGK